MEEHQRQKYKAQIEALRARLSRLEEILDRDEEDPEDQQPPSPEEAFMKAIQARLPGLSSQAQMNAFMATFDALCFTVNAICLRNAEHEEAGLKAFKQALHVTRTATEITEKLRDVPEAATSAVSEEFKKPPFEFSEREVQQSLLAELQAIKDPYQFYTWYTLSKERRDLVRSQGLRNELYDTIRAKNASFPKDA